MDISVNEPRHGNQPPLKDRLALDYETLAQLARDAAASVPEDIAVASADDAATATELAKQLKGLAADIEAMRKKEKQPHLDAGRVVDGFFERIAAPVEAAARKVVGLINKWQTEEHRKAALFDDGAKAKDTARVISESGTKATASTKWDYEITDVKKVPRQYLMINDMAIKAAIAGGKRDIAGLRIFEQVRTTIR